MRRIVAALSALLTAVIMFAVASPAYATSEPSNKAYYGPVNGINYFNQSIVSTNDVASSSYSIGRNGSGNIPAGWSGGQSSLYFNGALCHSSSLYYYDTATTGWSGLGGYGSCGSGTYKARGSTAAYTGNGYNYYYTDTSPNLNIG